ncbi:MAG: diacylglycerol kinase family lipid kinase [Flavobacteriales bacterium]|nr:diacylglycerol kinase family lipid kinase [Flavobacteriales bacterium]
MTFKTLIIVNGSKPQALKKAKELLQKVSFCDILKTEQRGSAITIAEKLVNNYHLIVAIGGDGTVNEVVNGMIRGSKESLNSTALAVLACGTGNDFARNLSYSTGVDELVKAIDQRQFRFFDIGLVANGTQHKRYFINSMDAGFGFEAMRRVDLVPRFVPSSLIFPLGIASTFLTYKKANIVCEADTFEYRGLCLTIVVANAPWFGSGLCIAPGAAMDDQLFDITIIGNVSLFDFLRYLPSLRRGKKIEHPEVHYFRASKIRIAGNTGIEIDGELPEFGLPVDVSMPLAQIRILV